MPVGVFLNPEVVSTALSSIAHRFALIIESEGKPSNTYYNPPKFCVGSANAGVDPRLVSVEELISIDDSRADLRVPSGWAKVHQYIYSISTATDDNGWQYRSIWSKGALGPREEQWKSKGDGTSRVRRRLWLTTIVRWQDLLQAKRRLTDAVQSTVSNVVLYQGPLERHENTPGILNTAKRWQMYHAVLHPGKLDLYSEQVGGEPCGRPLDTMALCQCDARMLFGSQCEGKEYSFTVTNPAGNISFLLSSVGQEERRQWVVSICYQVALYSPDLNFPPILYGPLTGDVAHERVLMCGELFKQGHIVRNWKLRFCQLRANDLMYFKKDVLKGKIELVYSDLSIDEASLEFSVRTHNGKVLVMRAGDRDAKTAWTSAIKQQIQLLTYHRTDDDANNKHVQEMRKSSFEHDLPQDSVLSMNGSMGMMSMSGDFSNVPHYSSSSSSPAVPTNTSLNKPLAVPIQGSPPATTAATTNNIDNGNNNNNKSASTSTSSQQNLRTSSSSTVSSCASSSSSSLSASLSAQASASVAVPIVAAAAAAAAVAPTGSSRASVQQLKKGYVKNEVAKHEAVFTADH